MRSLLGFAVTLVLIAASCVDGRAIGAQSAGNEECRCRPLVAAGIIPDALNNLQEASGLRFLSPMVDNLALEIRSVMGQMGLSRERFARVEVDIPESRAPKKALAKTPSVKKNAKAKVKVKIPAQVK